MSVKFTVEIERENDNDTGTFLASSDGAAGDVIFIGNGETPYGALHDLINEFENAELYMPD